MFKGYFFVMPSRKTGAARVLDIGGTFDRGSYLLSHSPSEADARATASDWAAVGQDMKAAIAEYESERSE